MASCPKCGSTQILQDECLSCGVILSKIRSASDTSSAPISYVVPTDQVSPKNDTSAKGAQWTPAGRVEADSRMQVRKSDPALRKLIWAVVFILLVGGAYQLYRMVMHRAAAYTGYYRNGQYLFSLYMPEEGWFHFTPTELGATEFKDASDGFYRGNSSRNPEIVLAIWMEIIPSPVPDRFNESVAQRLKDAIEQEIETRLSRSGFQCEITESGRRRIADNDGFFFHANMEKGEDRLKTKIFTAFNGTRAYTIQFWGRDTDLLQYDSETESIISSFSFRMSII